jgi:hypothetical protein
MHAAADARRSLPLSLDAMRNLNPFSFAIAGCCTSPYPPYEIGTAASSFSIYFGSSAQQLTGTHAGNGLITFSSPAATVGTAVSLELTFDGGSTTVSNGAAFEVWS